MTKDEENHHEKIFLSLVFSLSFDIEEKEEKFFHQNQNSDFFDANLICLIVFVHCFFNDFFDFVFETLKNQMQIIIDIIDIQSN